MDVKRIIDQIEEISVPPDHDPHDPTRPPIYPFIHQDRADRDGITEHQQRKRAQEGGQKRMRERRVQFWVRVAFVLLILAAAYAGAWALVGLWLR